jgi:SAM-dependent methyltransferase
MVLSRQRSIAKRTALRAIAVIQANYPDLLGDDRDPSHYCLGALRQSRHIDRIVIAAPDLPENQAMVTAAQSWGVDCHLGSEFDVTARIISAAQAVGASDDTVLARVLLNRYYLDIDLVDSQIELLEKTRSDFVILPYDFNINFGADVLTLACLKRADEMMGPEDMSERFRPWLFVEEHADAFRVSTLEDVPAYPKEKLERIRTNNLARERECGDYKGFTYQFASKFLSPTDKVLDLGCGRGVGSAMLAKNAGEVRGADYDPEAAAEARARNKGIANLGFDVENAMALDYPDGSFDAVVSSHLMEHVTDDALMLQNVHRVLRPAARLILEVPLLAERPFGAPLIPSHLREYRRPSLLALIERSGFVVEQKFGVNRGRHVDWDRAREAALVVARKQ